MTLDEAFKQFSESEDYKAIALKRDAKGGKYRVYLSRFKKGDLKAGAITEILLANGYEVSANKARRATTTNPITPKEKAVKKKK